MSLSQRKQTAKRMLIAETWENNRKFDDCFEMGDGAQVVAYLVQFALHHKTAPKPTSGGVKELKQLCKFEQSEKLYKKLMQNGFQNWFEIAA